MSTVATQSTSNVPKPRTLRWWPAALLLALMFALPYLPKLFEAPGIPMMMVSFMGPGAAGMLILVWWLFASRASIPEKLVGVVGVLLVGGTAIYFLHPTLEGMGVTIHVVPAALAAFAIPLVLLAAHPAYRLPAALLCMTCACGYWDSMRSNGVTGGFNSELEWRWRPTAEQIYLESLASRKPATSDAALESLAPIHLASAEWPSFRGPRRDGKQPGVVLNEDWQASPPRRLWQTKIGPAWSSFSLAGERLFTQEQRGDNEAVVCLNANTGETLWVHEYASRFWEAIGGAGPRATPTIADEGLFALGANGILMCLNPQNGQVIWQTDLRTDAKRQPPGWGFSASPLVTGGMVIVHAGGNDDRGVIAYDAVTGGREWTAASGDHSYSSPQLATLDSVIGVLMETNAGLQFLDPENGELLWQHEWPVQNYRALQPLVVGNTVLIAATLGAGTRSITVSRDGELWKTEENWTTRDLKPDYNDFVEHKGFLYGFDGSIFSCVELASGKRKWKRGRYGNGQVVLLPDADQLLVSSETGDLVLVRADSDQLVELAKFPALEGKTWNHPVVVGNRVYIRNAEQAACYQVATK